MRKRLYAEKEEEEEEEEEGKKERHQSCHTPKADPDIFSVS